jgi:hypothetical protein
MNRFSKQRMCRWACWLLFLLGPLAISLSAQSPRVEILTSVKHGVTPPLRSFVPYLHAKPNPPLHVFPLGRPIPPEAKGGKPGSGGGHGGGGGGSTWTDPDLTNPTGTNNGTLGSTFTGIVAGCGTSGGCVPADPNLSVSPTQIIETVNVSYEVWNKPSFGATNPKVAVAQAPIHTIFAGLGNGDICATTDGGDPVVLWDNFDQRWIVSQLAYNSSLSNNHWCMAISNGSSASASSWTAYDFIFGSNFPDYPKLGIWLDGTTSTTSPGPYSGVYLSVNTFSHGNKFAGAKACAFPLSDVTALPSAISLVCSQQSSSVYNILPADTDGSGAGPSGTGGLYLQFQSSSGVGNTLALYEFRPDFNVTQNSTFSLLQSIPVKTFHEACGGSACVPQPGTSEPLDSLGDRLMYRLAYRNSGPFLDTLFVNQSVQVSSSSNQTGIRWYEIGKATTSPTVIQGTYSPNTSLYRWMGSIAADKYGDLGLAYSTSSSSAYPGLAFTGRIPTDSPANALDTEDPFFTGFGSQTSVNRWGDYSSISVDPTDDCTFWYVNEYLQTTGSYTNWATEIASFRIGTNCTN